jgi:hypothetical protein
MTKKLTTAETIALKHWTRTRGSHVFTTELGKSSGYCAICKIDFKSKGKTFKEPRIAGPCYRCGIVGQCSTVCGDVVAFGFRLVSNDGWDLFATGEAEVSDLAY